MKSFSGAAILVDERYSWIERSVGLVVPRPPSLTGRENNSRSVSLEGALPVRTGMKRRFGLGAVRVRCGYGTGAVRYVNVLLLPTVHPGNYSIHCHS